MCIQKIDCTHKGALWILSKEHEFTSGTFLTQSGSFGIHAGNLEKLMIEMFKFTNNLNPSIMWEFHEKKHAKYDIRRPNLCELPQIKIHDYWKESLLHPR